MQCGSAPPDDNHLLSYLLTVQYLRSKYAAYLSRYPTRRQATGLALRDEQQKTVDGGGGLGTLVQYEGCKTHPPRHGMQGQRRITWSTYLPKYSFGTKYLPYLGLLACFRWVGLGWKAKERKGKGAGERASKLMGQAMMGQARRPRQSGRTI